MTATVWAIAYAIEAKDREAYLAWFHGMHIPEKLGRPRYDWAAHYESAEGGRYLALFGGADARAFIDPTPGQMKLQQDALTREMIAHRRGVSAWVFAEVLRSGKVDAAPAAVTLAVYAAQDADASAVNLVQSRLGAGGVAGASFLVPILGSGRHALLQFLDAPAASLADGDVYAFAGRRIDR